MALHDTDRIIAADQRHLLDPYQIFDTYLTDPVGKPGDKPVGFGFMTDTIHHLSSPNHYRYENGRTEQEFADDLITELEATVAELGGPQHVAAMFAEPLMGSGGVIVPPADYLQRAWRFCKDNDILFVADEVVTGFGRLGEWFVSDTTFGIQPDMITSAKGLASGYLPLGALISTDEVFDVIAEEGHSRDFAVGYF